LLSQKLAGKWWHITHEEFSPKFCMVARNGQSLRRKTNEVQQLLTNATLTQQSPPHPWEWPEFRVGQYYAFKE